MAMVERGGSGSATVIGSTRGPLSATAVGV
jgi:hypothetical protein